MGKIFYSRLSMPLTCRDLDDVYGGQCFSLAMDHFGRIIADNEYLD